MTHVESKVLPSPPSLVKALLAGFDTISKHIGLIIFCVILDLFLWLGPRLSVNNLMRSLWDSSAFSASTQSPEMADLMQLNQEALSLIGERLNFFAFLRTFPVGIPSLMITRLPISNPAGNSLSWEIPSYGVAILIWVFLILLGLLVGSLFFKFIAQASLQGRVDWIPALKQWPKDFTQIVLLSIFWLGVLFAISIPLACVLPFIISGGGSLGMFILVLYAGVLMWLLLPLVFAPHGIFVDQNQMWPSVVQSARLARFTLPTTGLFLLSAIILSQGMDFVWNRTNDQSWLTTIGVLGHAFVTTSLIAASFVYYRDANNWLQRLMQQTKLSSHKT